jgi:hypothetical protein
MQETQQQRGGRNYSYKLGKALFCGKFFFIRLGSFQRRKLIVCGREMSKVNRWTFSQEGEWLGLGTFEWKLPRANLCMQYNIAIRNQNQLSNQYTLSNDESIY